MSAPSSPARRHGIATIANDRMIDWVLPFLESWQTTNAATPLYVIPYDENHARTKQACMAYGAELVLPDSFALDALARRLYPLFPGHRRRLRKFLALALPLDEVAYVDIDIVLFRDFRPLFGLLDPGTRDFIVASPVDEYVYNKKGAAEPSLQGKLLFNDGFFVTSNKILSLQDFQDVIDADEKLFHSVRQRGMLFAQPLTNFVVHRRGLKIASLFEAVPGASGESFYKAKDVRFEDGLPVDAEGRGIYFAHWAGLVGLPGRRVFDAAWHSYAAKAAARLNAKQGGAVTGR
jgi:hypothetical protein